MKIFILLIFFFVSICRLSAQQFGGNLPGTKWRQINSDTARIIFPKGLDSVAGSIANIISELANKQHLNLGNRLNKIDIVLQNQTANTNGYVGLGPFRSEFYTTPPADNFSLGTLTWPTQLSLHEYRHVQQYNNFNNGLSAVMKRLFGQEGYALAINTAIPDWFFEGDAVHQETILSVQGRGRMPAFLKTFPAMWQSGKNYSWMKLRNGSLKDYTPNHYELGYLMVNYGVEKYGTDFWKKVTHDASAFKGLFYPMQKAVKKHSSLPYKVFTNNAFSYYKNLYDLQSKESDVTLNKNNVFNADEKLLTNYYYPFQVSKNELLYLKESNNKRAAFYLKTATEERFIRFRDISLEDQFSYRNGKIVYAAYETNPRWRWNSYSVIKIIDIKTTKQKTLTHKTKYFSPDISPDGSLIAANKVDLDGSSSLIILNATNGAIIKEIKQNDISYFSNPKIINNNTVFAIVRYNDATTSISKINIETGLIENVTPRSLTVTGQIDVRDEKIYFSASQNFKDEIFYFDIQNNQLYKMATTGVGSYFVNADHKKITWSSFTANGYQLKQINADDAEWNLVSTEDFTKSKTGIVANPLNPNELNSNKKYTSKKYSALTHPINFHSWRPNYNSPEFSFTIYGNNVLNTTETQLYYLFNENDKTHTAGGSIVYAGLFPFISLGSDYTFDRKSISSNKIKNWNEWNSYAGLSVPLSWVSNRTHKSLNISSNYFYRTDFNKGENKNYFKALKFSYLSHGISWSQQIQTTVQDIYPRFGYSTNIQFRHTLNLYKSWQSNAAINLFLPGLFRAQSIVLNGAVQYSGTDQRVFGNRIAYARGYAGLDSAGAYTAKANYHFTLFYPDFGFANIVYLQRVRANLFYDYTQAFNKNASSISVLQSTGAEIYFDTKWWNQHPLTLGFRVGKFLIPTQKGNDLFFEFVLPTSLIPR